MVILYIEREKIALINIQQISAKSSLHIEDEQIIVCEIC